MIWCKKETNDVLLFAFYRFENSDNIALKKDVSRLNMKKGKERGVMNLLKSLNYKIFTPVAIFIVAFVIYGIAAPSSFASFTTTVKDWAGTHFAWLAYFIIVACVFACIYMCISKIW